MTSETDGEVALAPTGDGFAAAPLSESDSMETVIARPRPKPMFLERDTYRRRRLADASRLLPIFGAALLLVPIFWTEDQASAQGLIYILGVWAGIIVLSGILSRALTAPLRDSKASVAAKSSKVASENGA